MSKNNSLTKRFDFKYTALKLLEALALKSALASISHNQRGSVAEHKIHTGRPGNDRFQGKRSYDIGTNLLFRVYSLYPNGALPFVALLIVSGNFNLTNE